MRFTSIRPGIVALIALVPLAACGDKGGEAGDVTPTTIDEIPTQEELDAEAAKEITEENADAAFEELQNEVDSDQ
jgi:hypothetical protein